MQSMLDGSRGTLRFFYTKDLVKFQWGYSNRAPNTFHHNIWYMQTREEVISYGEVEKKF